MLASVQGYTESVKMLLAVPGVDLDSVALNGKNALALAEAYDQPDIVQLLNEPLYRGLY